MSRLCKYDCVHIWRHIHLCVSWHWLKQATVKFESHSSLFTGTVINTRFLPLFVLFFCRLNIQDNSSLSVMISSKDLMKPWQDSWYSKHHKSQAWLHTPIILDRSHNSCVLERNLSVCKLNQCAVAGRGCHSWRQILFHRWHSMRVMICSKAGSISLQCFDYYVIVWPVLLCFCLFLINLLKSCSLMHHLDKLVLQGKPLEGFCLETILFSQEDTDSLVWDVQTSQKQKCVTLDLSNLVEWLI